MAQFISGDQVTQHHIKKALGWGQHDDARLHAFFLNSCQDYFVSFMNDLSKAKESPEDGHRGPNNKSVVDSCIDELRSGPIHSYISSTAPSAMCIHPTTLKRHVWFILKLVKTEQTRGGIWANKTHHELRDCCESALLILRYLKKMVKKGRSAEQYFETLRAGLYGQENEDEEEGSVVEDESPFPSNMLFSLPFLFKRNENGDAYVVTPQGSYPKQSIT
ncbi:hypothetical protein BGZ57DRAFT_442765 [Hyaloscypha finlandica]|nr:hypothetical protein BGZ57DRAFT_442765 [Hyaloscypha finlandica]